MPSRSVVRSPSRPMREDEGQGERDAGEVGGDAREGHQPARGSVGGPPEMTAYAIRNPKMPPARAVTRLISMLVEVGIELQATGQLRRSSGG